MKKLVLYYDKNMKACKKKDAYFIKVYKGDRGMNIYLVKPIESTSKK